MSNYPLATSTWDDEELKAIQLVMDSNKFTMGDHVRTFENNFGNFINRKYNVMVSSGSAANLLSIASMFYTNKPMLKAGDEVIVPAVSWSTTYFPLQQFGLKLKFVDIDLETLNYDLDGLKTSITNKTKLIVIVNLLLSITDCIAFNSSSSHVLVAKGYLLIILPYLKNIRKFF